MILSVESRVQPTVTNSLYEVGRSEITIAYRWKLILMSVVCVSDCILKMSQGLTGLSAPVADGCMKNVAKNM